MITRTYNALNRVISYTDVKGNTLHYEYDEVSNLITLTYPDNKQQAVGSISEASYTFVNLNTLVHDTYCLNQNLRNFRIFRMGWFYSVNSENFNSDDSNGNVKMLREIIILQCVDLSKAPHSP